VAQNNPFFQNPLDKVTDDILAKKYELPALSGIRAQSDGRIEASRDVDGILPPEQYQPLFINASQKYGVPANILMSLAQQESSYNPEAIGPETKWGKAKGMMQYIDDTAKGMGIDPMDPAQSVDAAAKQFKQRIDAGYSVEEAVMAHHAGDNREQWGPKTRKYVREVLGRAGGIAARYQPKDPTDGGRYRDLTPEELAVYQAKQSGIGPKTTDSEPPGLIERAGSALSGLVREPGTREQMEPTAELGQAARKIADAGRRGPSPSGGRAGEPQVDQEVDAFTGAAPKNPGADQKLPPTEEPADEELDNSGRSRLEELEALAAEQPEEVDAFTGAGPVKTTTPLDLYRKGIALLQRPASEFDFLTAKMDGPDKDEKDERRGQFADAEVDAFTGADTKAQYTTIDGWIKNLVGSATSGVGTAAGSTVEGSGLIAQQISNDRSNRKLQAAATRLDNSRTNLGLRLEDVEGEDDATRLRVAEAYADDIFKREKEFHAAAVEWANKEPSAAADWIRGLGVDIKKLSEQLQADPEYDGKLTDVSAGIGSMLIYLGPGFLTTLMTRGAPMAIRQIAGLAGGASLAGPAGAAEAYNRAIQYGLPEELAIKTSMKGIPAGIIQVAPLAVILKGVAPGVRGKVLSQFRHILEVFGAEFVAEGAGAVMQNLVEKSYNPEKGVWDDSLYQAAIGGSSAALISLGIQIATRGKGIRPMDKGEIAGRELDRQVKGSAWLESAEMEALRRLDPHSYVQTVRDQAESIDPEAVLSGDLSVAQKTPDGPIEAAAAETSGEERVANVPGERVTVATLTGNINGIVNLYEEDGPGEFQVQILAENGEMYVFDQNSDVTIVRTGVLDGETTARQGDDTTPPSTVTPMANMDPIDTAAAEKEREENPEGLDPGYRGRVETRTGWLEDVAESPGDVQDLIDAEMQDGSAPDQSEARTAFLDAARSKYDELTEKTQKDRAEKSSKEKSAQDRFPQDPMDRHKFGTPNPDVRLQEGRKERRDTGRGTFVASQPSTGRELARGTTQEEAFSNAEAKLKAASEKAEPAPETTESGEAIVGHTTKKGKDLRGVLRDIPLSKAKEIDPSAFRKSGKSFIRLDSLEKAREKLNAEWEAEWEEQGVENPEQGDFDTVEVTGGTRQEGQVDKPLTYTGYNGEERTALSYQLVGDYRIAMVGNNVYEVVDPDGRAVSQKATLDFAVKDANRLQGRRAQPEAGDRKAQGGVAYSEDMPRRVPDDVRRQGDAETKAWYQGYDSALERDRAAIPPPANLNPSSEAGSPEYQERAKDRLERIATADSVGALNDIVGESWADQGRTKSSFFELQTAATTRWQELYNQTEGGVAPRRPYHDEDVKKPKEAEKARTKTPEVAPAAPPAADDFKEGPEQATQTFRDEESGVTAHVIPSKQRPNKPFKVLVLDDSGKSIGTTLTPTEEMATAKAREAVGLPEQEATDDYDAKAHKKTAPDDPVPSDFPEGFEPYRANIRGKGETWAVPAVRGQRGVGGDTLHDSLDEALTQAQSNVRQEDLQAQNQRDTDAQVAQEGDSEAARQSELAEIGEILGIPKMRAGRARDTLNKRANFNGREMTHKARIEQVVEQGAVIEGEGPARELVFGDNKGYDQKTLTKTGMDYAEALIGRRGLAVTAPEDAAKVEQLNRLKADMNALADRAEKAGYTELASDLRMQYSTVKPVRGDIVFRDINAAKVDDILRAREPAVVKAERKAAIAAGGAAPSTQATSETQATVTTPGGETFRDTRGQGERFHGTNQAIEGLNSYSYSAQNFYGQGFYTTDAVDIAKGYGRKGRGGEAQLYTVTVTGSPLLYDLNAEMDAQTRAKVAALLGDTLDLTDGSITTLGEAMDAARESAGDITPADEVQESFDAVVASLEARGYQGFRHVGGQRTGSPAHDVRIYWTPADTLEVMPTEFDAYRADAGGAAPSTQATDSPTGQAEASVEEKIKADSWGANNTLVTQDRAEILRAKLRAKFGTLNSGFDPEMLAAGAELAAFNMEAGVRKFGEFARAMAADIGVGINDLRPYLRGWYNGGRDMMEDNGLDVSDMDGPDQVRDQMKGLFNAEETSVTEAMEEATERRQEAADDAAGATSPSAKASANERLRDQEERVTKLKEETRERAIVDSPEGEGRTTPTERTQDDTRADSTDRDQSLDDVLPEGDTAFDPAGDPAPIEGIRPAVDEGDGGAPGDRTRPEDGMERGEQTLPDSPAVAGGNSGRAGGVEGGGRAGGARSPSAGPVNRTENRPNTLKGESPGNFRITPEMGIGTGTAGQKLKDNMAAIRLAKKIKAEGRFATREEQAALARFVGWGGLKTVFDPKKAGKTDQFGRAQDELKGLLTAEEYADANSSIQNAHFTSESVVGMMWRAARHFGFTGGRALEPTVGSGNFIGMAPDDFAAATEWFASELDPVSSSIAGLLYPDSTILEATGFQEAHFASNVMDISIGNPPFGQITIRSRSKKWKHLDGMKIHNYIIAKAGEHLRPGGIMPMVVTHRFLDTANPEARSELAKNFRFLGAVRLPNNAFAANAGTDVTTDLVFLQKLRADESPDLSASWLNTNGEIDVDGVKIRVNGYYQENPTNILGKSTLGGSMYAAEGEYTVESDGRDLDASFNKILAEDWASLAGAMKPTQGDLDAAPVFLEKSDLAIGSMMLNADGQIIYRDLDDSVGNAVIRQVTPESYWKEKAAQWGDAIEAVAAIKTAREVGDPVAKDQVQALVDAAGVATTASGGKKPKPTKAEQAIYDVLDATANPRFTWRHDDGLAAMEATLERRRLGRQGFDTLRKLLDIRNRALALLQAEKTNDPAMDSLRADLNVAYDQFVSNYGLISEPKNISLLTRDIGIESGLEANYQPEVKAAEAKRKNSKPRKATAEKHAMFSERVTWPKEEITSADNALDGMNISLSERGRLDVAYISALTGRTGSQVIEDLTTGKDPAAFYDPEQLDYIPYDEYLSGNVNRKLEVARADNLEANITALEKALPAPLTKERITPNIRGTWIPDTIFEDFLTALGVVKPSVLVQPTIGRISAKDSVAQLTDLGTQFDDADRSVIDLFNAAVSGKPIRVMRSVPDSSPREDKPASQRATAKAERMSSVFREWVYSEPDRAAVVVDAYNRVMNTNRERDWNGEKFLKPVGQSPSVKLRRTQKNAAWRMIQRRNMLMDHLVGSGKTISVITGVMERKRLGLSRKPAIVVPNHLVVQWASEFYQLYPGAKILAATPDDFSKNNRRRMFARIASGNYDAIIMGHSSFGFISPPDADTKMIITENKAQLKEALDAAKESGESGRSLNQIQAKLDAYDEQLKNLSERPRDEIGIDIESMGIDYLAVDECFSYDTEVETDQGMMKIGDIVEGKLPVRVKSVDSSTHAVQWKPVTNWYAHQRRLPLIEVFHESGSFLCTPNHNIWVEGYGYKRAGDIGPQDRLITTTGAYSEVHQANPRYSAVSMVRDGHYVRGQHAEEILQRVLQDVRPAPEPGIAREMEGRDASYLGELSAQGQEVPGSIGENDRQQPHALAGDAQESVQDADNDGTPSGDTREQWVPDRTSNLAGGSHRSADGSSGEHEINPPSDGQAAQPLQDRPGVPGPEAGSGDRREFAQNDESQRTGREEGPGIVTSRVVGIAILEPDSDGEYRFGGRDHSVIYDIEVADNHNYFANGALVSNSHMFKNLEYATSGERVVGMTNPKGSARAFDLYTKVRGIQERGGGAVFATGTPVSNSLVELYTMMRYLAHDQLKERGQDHFDAWSGAYAVTETRMEYTATQKLKPRRVLSGLANLDGLGQLYRDFADILTMSDLKRVYTEEKVDENKRTGGKERTDFPIPKVKGGGRQLDSAGITEQQSEYMDYLVARMKGIEANTSNPDYKKVDNALWVMTDARKMSLDIRIIDPLAERDETGKVMRSARRIKDIYDRWDADKGAQLVFSDLSTPSKTSAKEAKGIVKSAATLIFGENPGKAALKRIKGMSYRDQWKWMESAAEKALEDPAISTEKQDKIEEFMGENALADATMLVADKGFSVYDDLRTVLEEMGIPSHEIAFIHDYNSPEAKDRLFSQVNSGAVRVLIGSTDKMGTGTNAQERLVALHHLDAPWRPSDVEQREGRIIRQGNLLHMRDPDGFEVEITNYSTNGTFDTVMWQILERKAASIEQFRSTGIDNITEDEGDSDQYAEFMATSTGNPIFKLKLEAERDLLNIQAEIGGNLIASRNAKEFVASYDSKREELADRSEYLSRAEGGNISYNGATGDPADLKTAMDAEKARFHEDFAAWEAAIPAAKEAREAARAEGKKKLPALPPRPTPSGILSDAVQKKSAYARVVKAALVEVGIGGGMNTSSKEVDLKVGSIGVTVRRRANPFNDNSSYEVLVKTGDSKEVSIASSQVLNPENSEALAKGFMPDRMQRAIADSKESIDGRIEKMDSRLEREKELAAKEIDRTPIDEANQLVSWYTSQVSLAEEASDLQRGERSNRFIAKDQTRDVAQFGAKEVAESQSLEIEGEVYETTGLSVGTDRARMIDATRQSDGRRAVVSEEKGEDGESSYSVRVEPDAAIEQMRRATAQSNARRRNRKPSQSPAEAEQRIRQGSLGEVSGRLLDSGKIKIDSVLPSGLPTGTAAYVDEQGVIHLVARNLEPQYAEATLLHEAFHAGARPLIGSRRWNELQDRLGKLYSQAERSTGFNRQFWDAARERISAAEAAGDVMTDARRIEEFGAYALEEFASAPRTLKVWANDMVGRVQAWLQRTFGIQVGQVSPAQLRALAAAALRNGDMAPSPSLSVEAPISLVDENGNPVPERERKAEVARAVRAARKALSVVRSEAGVTDFDGGFTRDITKIGTWLHQPYNIASLEPQFTPVFKTAMRQQRFRDTLISEMYPKFQKYKELRGKGRANVNKVLELGRLANRSFTDARLRSGLTNPGEKRTTVFDANGEIQYRNQTIHTALSAKGDVIKLTAEERVAYFELREMFDEALDRFRDQTLIDMGMGEFSGSLNPLKDIMDSITDDMSDVVKDRLINMAKMVEEIDQAKRTGYVPLSRFGRYSITVKEKQADIKYASNPEGGWIARDVPDEYTELLASVGATYDNLEGGWQVSDGQKRQLNLENNRTIYSEKIDPESYRGRYDAYQAARGNKKITDVAFIRDAKARVEREWGGEGRQIITLDTKRARLDGTLKLSDIDSLADLSQIDTETWDRVRDEFAKAMRGRGFRKHFFRSDNVPGYDLDFERSIADYIAGMSGYLSRRHHENQWESAVAGVKGPVLNKYSKEYRQYVNEPTEEYAILRQAGFLFYIAGNVSTALLNWTQVPIMTMPALSQVMGHTRAASEVTRAYKDALAMTSFYDQAREGWVRGGPKGMGDSMLQMFDPNDAPADVRTEVFEAWEDGMFSPQFTHEVMGFTGKKDGSPSAALEKGIDYIASAYTYIERLNRLVTFIAAVRAAKDPKIEAKARENLKGNALARLNLLDETWSPKAFGEFIVDESQFMMGKVNRAKILRGPGAPIFQFMSFVMNSLQAWYRWSRVNGGSGKMATAYSIGAVAALSGVWGVPLLDPLRAAFEALWREITGEDEDIKYNLREWISRETGQNWLGEIADKGALYPLGADMSGRIGFMNMLPGTSSVVDALGIPGDLLLGRPYRATKEIQSEDYWGAAAELSPTFVRNIITAQKWRSEGVRSRTGRQYLTPKQIPQKALWLKSFGIQPSIVSDAYQYKYSVYREQTKMDDATARWVNKIASAYAAEARNTDPDRAPELASRIDRLIDGVLEYNAANPDSPVNVTNDKIRNRANEYLYGLGATAGGERKSARAAAERAREVFNLNPILFPEEE